MNEAHWRTITNLDVINTRSEIQVIQRQTEVHWRTITNLDVINTRSEIQVIQRQTITLAYHY